MSTTNINSAQPAHPYLAPSLLLQHDSRVALELDTSPYNKRGIPTDDWRLHLDSERGFDVFPAGAVVGFSKLKQRGNGDDEYGEVGELCRSMLVAHLRRHHPSQSSQSKVFIIHPANYASFTPEALLESLLVFRQQPALISREEAISLLDNVQLLPVYDFTGALQAIGSVSAEIQRLHDTRQELYSYQPAAKTTSTTTDDTDDILQQHQQQQQSAIFLVVGLDTLAQGVVRASSPLKGAALLSSALRALTQISRRHASYPYPVRVILINTNGLGSNPNSVGQTDLSSAGADHAEGIHSAFRGTGGGGGTSAVLLPSLLMRVLDQGLDTHLLLSQIRQTWVVEVVKDRLGESVGKWCIWQRKNG